MKLKICILAVLAVLIVNAEDTPAKTAPKAKKSPAPPAALTLPAGATQVEPGTYTFTDAKGKKWIYRQTPFGLARMEDKPAETAPAAKGPPITATEAGDVIKFERPGPFGPYRWEKKKSDDLADDERAALERSRNKQDTASKGKQE
jgi:hypothetical protein